MKKIIPIFMIFSVLLSGCEKKEQSDKMTVFTSFYAMYDFARQIGGDKVDVVNMVPVGVEPHDYEPTASEIAQLTESDLFIYNGKHMEAWADNVVKNLPSNMVIMASENIITENIFDPHVWLDPNNALTEMESIKNAFSAKDPENAQYYEDNFNDISMKISELNSAYETELVQVLKKDIITSHAAYGYLCHAYGINQIPIEGYQGDGDPSPAQMAEIVNFAKENDIKYIFAEELDTTKVVESIAKEIDAEILILNPFEGDIQDRNYFDVMYDNLVQLKVALQ